MSFQEAKMLVDRNKCSEELVTEKNDSATQKDNNLLLSKYIEQAARYQELVKEIDIYQKRKNVLQNSPITTETIKKDLPLSLTSFNSQDISFDLRNKTQISTFLEAQNDFYQAKSFIINLLYLEATEMNEESLQSSNSQDKNACKEEIKEILELILWLKNLEPEIKIVDSKTLNNKPIKNKLIFLSSATGRIIAYDELMSLPKDCYPTFLELLKSIQNGTFKGFKSLHPKKISEVKWQDARVIFRKINENTYLICSCFIKNYTSNIWYKDFLERLNSTVIAQEDAYKALSEIPAFMLEQAKIEDDIFQLIERKRGEMDSEFNCERKLK